MAASQEVEVDPSMDPETSEVTTPESLGFKRGRRQAEEVEIEVESLRQAPVVEDANGMVEIRMAQTIEEFTYGNPHLHYRLEEGKRYKVPRYIAAYLFDLGYLYHRSG